MNRVKLYFSCLRMLSLNILSPNDTLLRDSMKIVLDPKTSFKGSTEIVEYYPLRGA